MNVLIVGGGGREHAIAQAVSRSRRVKRIFCAPGNAGIEAYATCVPVAATDSRALAAFAKEHAVDLTIVGMDDPLAGGIVDVFEAEGLRIFGPRRDAAILESSKAFAKALMMKYDIPCAASETFTDAPAAYAYIEQAKYPLVLKADGLALGKGVLICMSADEARDGIRAIMEEKQFGDAGNRLVVEEFLEGREVSILSFTDGEHYRLMSSAQDHKRAGDGDTGLNTGGMGTFSPSPFYTEEIDRICRETIFGPTVQAMRAEGRPFKGVIFYGLMLTADGPKVLEYNARFGDPETQVILPRMRSDIIDVMEACIDGTLDRTEVDFEDNAAVCVVLASGGYPLSYEKGKVISGLDSFGDRTDVFCFHAGTKRDGDRIVTNGGRVLGVTAIGGTLQEAREKAYEAAEQVAFDHKYMRHDIGKAITE